MEDKIVKLRRYKQTPLELMKILQIFRQNGLSYLLFKCEHIFAGENKNVDVLFETEEDYRKAARLLLEKGFVLRMSERVEKYKSMYCGLLDGILYSVHLHREIAWHGIKALDKELVFERKKTINPLIIIPSLEDSILIHAAHVLFENFKVGEREKKYFELLKKKERDSHYIKKQLRINKWEKGFRRVINCKKEIFFAWLPKLLKEPSTVFYLSRKMARIVLRELIPKRRGCLIALIGVNGSGKSTLTKKILGAYEPLTKHLGLKQQGYYFGWEPYSFYAKAIAARNKNKGKKVFDSVNQEKKLGLFREVFFIYNFLEYYWRYLWEVRPALVKNRLVVTDRYFYDLSGQYNFAPQSFLIKLLLKIYPRPDFLFILDAPIEEIRARGKEENLSGVSKSPKRIVLNQDYLERQKERYYDLANRLGGVLVDTQKEKESNVAFIVEKSWKKIAG